MKYYWLKLDKNFFQQHDVRMIESMPDGKEMILFYIKLLAESVSHDGDLRFSDDIAYDNQMLAGITNTDISIVEKAMALFQKLKLVEVKEDETITMTEVAEMTGSETDWAKKKRDYRERHPEDNVHKKSGQEEDKVGQSPIRDKRQEIRDKNNKDILCREKADEVIAYLNNKLGSRYRSRDLIKARLNEGYSVEDFKTVIDKKYKQWHDDPKMCPYLRPETLFCKSHFESYLNEIVKSKQGFEQADYDFKELERVLAQ